MPAPRFASNAFIEINNVGAVPPIGTLRCTTDISIGRNSNAKATPTTTGEVGFSTGVGMSEVTTTVAVQIGPDKAAEIATSIAANGRSGGPAVAAPESGSKKPW